MCSFDAICLLLLLVRGVPAMMENVMVCILNDKEGDCCRKCSRKIRDGETIGLVEGNEIICKRCLKEIMIFYDWLTSELKKWDAFRYMNGIDYLN